MLHFSCSQLNTDFDMSVKNWVFDKLHAVMSATKFALQHGKYYYTSEDFKWPRIWQYNEDGQLKHELSKVN